MHLLHCEDEYSLQRPLFQIDTSILVCVSRLAFPRQFNLRPLCVA